MKQFKGFVIVFAGLFLFITLLSLLIPSRVMIVRSVEISGPSSYIFSEISDLANWKHWHPMFISDSDNIHVSKPSAGVNASAIWRTNGYDNHLKITDTGYDFLKAVLLRQGEKDISNILTVINTREPGKFQVEWRVLVTLKWYPWEKFYGIFLDKITGPGYEAALNNLKRHIEEKK